MENSVISNDTEVLFLKSKIKLSPFVFSPTVTNTTRFFIRNIKIDNNSTCFEVGVGTGTVLINLGLTYSNLTLHGSDINEEAVALCIHNHALNNLHCRIFNCHMLDEAPLEKYDNIIFNPPLIHEKPQNILEHSVFDQDGNTLKTFLRTAKTYAHDKSKIHVMYTNKNYEWGSSKDFFYLHAANEGYTIEETNALDAGYEKYTKYTLRYE